MSSMRDLKLASLYFDKVCIEAPFFVMSAIQDGSDTEILGLKFSNNDFLSHINSAKDIEFQGHQTRIWYDPDPDAEQYPDKLKGTITVREPGSDEVIRSIVVENLNLIFPSARREGESVIIQTGDSFSTSLEAESVYQEILRHVTLESALGAKLVWPDGEDEKKVDLLIKEALNKSPRRATPVQYS
jgi:hypothetical protein